MGLYPLPQIASLVSPLTLAVAKNGANNTTPSFGQSGVALRFPPHSRSGGELLECGGKPRRNPPIVGADVRRLC